MCKSRAARLLQQINCMVHGDIQRQALSREEMATLSCNLSLALSKLATAGLNDSSRHSRLAHGITQPAPGNHVRGVAERRSYRSQPGHFFAMATNQLILAVGRLARFAQLVPASDPPLPATRPCQRIQSKRETAPDSHILRHLWSGGSSRRGVQVPGTLQRANQPFPARPILAVSQRCGLV